MLGSIFPWVSCIKTGVWHILGMCFTYVSFLFGSRMVPICALVCCVATVYRTNVRLNHFHFIFFIFSFTVRLCLSYAHAHMSLVLYMLRFYTPLACVLCAMWPTKAISIYPRYLMCDNFKMCRSRREETIHMQSVYFGLISMDFSLVGACIVLKTGNMRFLFNSVSSCYHSRCSLSTTPQ